MTKFPFLRNAKKFHPFKVLNNLCVIEKDQLILETTISGQSKSFISTPFVVIANKI